MNKYYTPQKEEFYIGFEYEINEDFDTLPEKIWHCLIWDRENLNPESMTYPFPIKEEKIRVKCLDQDDIKELVGEGTSTHKNYVVISAPGNIGYWTEIVIDMRFGSDDLIISGRRGDEHGHLFRGEIKNKSELKRLLKQLNIIKQ